MEHKDLAKKTIEKQTKLKELLGENGMFSPMFSKLCQEYFSLWEALQKVKQELEAPETGGFEEENFGRLQ
jgi:predicted nuclease with TOPRIM domain